MPGETGDRQALEKESKENQTTEIFWEGVKVGSQSRRETKPGQTNYIKTILEGNYVI